MILPNDFEVVCLRISRRASKTGMLLLIVTERWRAKLIFSWKETGDQRRWTNVENKLLFMDDAEHFFDRGRPLPGFFNSILNHSDHAAPNGGLFDLESISPRDDE